MPELITDDGIRLRYLERGAGSTTVIFLHWMGGHAEMWTDLWDCFPSPAYRFIALDARGHGRSEPRPSSFDVHRIARDVVKVADTAGAQRFVLVGHSFGGKVALCAASLEPARVASLVLMGSVGPDLVPVERDLIDGILARASDEPFVRETFRAWFHVWPSPALDRALAQWSRTPAWALRAVAECAIFTDISAEVGMVSAPALVIAGADDPLYGPVYQVQAVQPFLRNARNVAIPGCGHGLILERPVEIAAEIDTFIRGRI